MRFTLSAMATTATFALMAGAASAQVVSCGGIGNEGQWMAGTQEASDIATSEGPLTLSALPIPQDGNSVGFFNISVATEIRAEAQPVDGGDSVIEIYDEAGTLVLVDDDSGGGWASRAETTLDPGNYCVAVRGWAGRSLVSDVRIGRLEHEDITQGLGGGFSGGFTDPFFVGIDPCTPDTQAVVLGTGPVDGQLFDGGVTAVNTISGVPYYRFTLESPQTISVLAENPSADPYIYFFDGAGNLLAENDDFQSLNSRIDFTTPLEAGEYCIGMRSLSNPDLPVTLSVLGYDAAAALADLYDTGDAAPPMDGSYQITDLGLLPGRSLRDAQISGRTATWFSFDVDVQGAIVIDVVEVTDSDPVIILYNDLGQEIAFNDDHGGTLNSQITARVQAGTYLLAVRQFADSYQGIVRIATERFVPAP